MVVGGRGRALHVCKLRIRASRPCEPLEEVKAPRVRRHARPNDERAQTSERRYVLTECHT